MPVHTFEIAVCCLPGIRLAGTRRSLVADLGKRADPKKETVGVCVCVCVCVGGAFIHLSYRAFFFTSL